MKKPLFVSIAGWLFVVLMTGFFTDGMIASWTHGQVSPLSGTALGFSILVSVPCLAVWMIGTMIHKVQVSQAKHIAEQMALRQMKQPTPDEAAGGPTLESWMKQNAAGKR